MGHSVRPFFSCLDFDKHCRCDCLTHYQARSTSGENPASGVIRDMSSDHPDFNENWIVLVSRELNPVLFLSVMKND